MADDNVQHGIDDNPSGDAAKGAALGGLGGAAVGAVAGSLIGPVGTVIGAAVGAISGAVGSGAAVAAVDAVDNDNTVSGIGGDASGDVSGGGSGGLHSSLREGGEGGGHNIVTGGEAHTDAGKGGLATGALAGGTIGAAVGGPVGAVVGGVVGSLAGGAAGDASEADDMTGTTGGSGSYGATMNTPMQSGTTAGGVVSSGPLSDDLGAVAGGANLTGNVRETDRDVMRVPVVEEQLNVGKEMREAGEVQVHKHIVEEQVSVPVAVQREEVVVTRHAVDRAVSSTEMSGDVLQDGETIRVPVREEVPVVSKEARVVEEVEIAKTRVADQQTVSDTVRREEVDIDDSTHTGGSMGTGRTI